MKNVDCVRKLVILFATFLLVSMFVFKLNYVFRPTDTDQVYEQVETFHSFPENSIEVIAYGSSHTFRGLSTMELYEKYGIGAYNYAWHWQKINTINLFLKDSLMKQHPKVVLIETFTVNSILQNANLTAESYYARYLHNEEARKVYIKQCIGENAGIGRKISYIFPFYMFHNNWKNISKKSFAKLNCGTYLRKTMGFSPSLKVIHVDIPDCTTFRKMELSKASLSELEDIVQTCKARNIDVVFYTVPWKGEFCYADALKKFAASHNCAYINLFEHIDDVGLDGDTDFSDEGHLNTSGSVKVADFLGNYLVHNYNLSDMRIIPNNLWEQALQMN